MPSKTEQRAARKTARERFLRTRKAGKWFERQLLAVARTIGKLVEGFAPEGVVTDSPRLMRVLEQYSELLRPWAENVAERMTYQVDQKDAKAWSTLGEELGQPIKKEIRYAPTGKILRNLLSEQVQLITSLPIKAGHRVHKLTLEGLSDSTRASEIAKEIMRTGEVTESRARLIARTEVARTASALTLTRAEAVGADSYIWRTSGDADVRELHKKLEGKVIKLDSPPVAGEDGERAHAGQIYNCFPGDTLVTPRDDILRIFRARYSGELIIVGTCEASFEATPNHPILTLRGWVPTKLLKDGDYLIKISDDRALTGVFDVNDGLISIEKMFETFRPNTERCSRTQVNLYGDAIEGEVDIVRTTNYLSLNDDSSYLRKSIDNNVITRTDCGVARSFVERLCSKIDQSLLSSRLDILKFLLFSSVSSKNPVGIRVTPNSTPVISEYFSDSDAVAAELLRQCDTTHPRLIKFNNGVDLVRVCNLNTRHFDSYVYTLQCLSGLYSVTPAQIIVANCRCWPEPIIPDIPKEYL